MKLSRVFYWDSNLYFGLVQSQSDLDELLNVVPDALDGKECPQTNPLLSPKFGFRAECSGVRTLREFLSAKVALK
jgi:hypothetical protein